MEYSTPPPTSLFQLNVDANNAPTLRSAASWAKVFGILGIIFGVLILVVGLAVPSIVKARYNQFETDQASNYAKTFLTTLCVLFGALTIIGSIFALSFGGKISTALRTNDSNSLRGGFAAVRNYFAFWAVLMIIYLLLMILGIATGASGLR